jgi:hypothetical protein
MDFGSMPAYKSEGGDGKRSTMKLNSDFWDITSRGPEAASQNSVELTWEVERNGAGDGAVKIMLTLTVVSVEFLTWGNLLVSTRGKAAFFALCQSNAFFVSSRQTHIITSVT